ncbi:MAG TPA: response regulator [Reyranella sp.]|nr:response regulator [Reyranella sp.]
MKSPASGAVVIVVEDEVIVRAATSHYLREAGCVVFEAATAEECLDLLTGKRPIDVVFADIRLPQRSGLELARMLQRTHPQVGVVLTTGARLAEPVPEGVTLLHKPYTLFEVERRIGLLRVRQHQQGRRSLGGV